MKARQLLRMCVCVVGIGLCSHSLLWAQTLDLSTYLSPNPENSGFFGYSVSNAGDVNNDGFNDVIIGAYSEDPGGSPDDAGRAYVISGQTGAVIYQLKSPNEESFGQFGISVSAAGDVDNDGFADVIVGAYREDPGGSPNDAGRAYVFSGQTGAVLYQLKSSNEESLGQFGISVSTAGDVDNDGHDDVIVGAYRESAIAGVSESGRAYVFSGKTGALLRTLVSPSTEEFGLFGFAVADAGDVDGDGFDDVVVGAPREDPGSSPSNAGRAYVFSGQDGSVLFSLRSLNEESFGQFGYAVAGAGDINADGKLDVIVGAYRENPGVSPSDAGRAYVFSGQNGNALLSLRSPNEDYSGQFGFAVDGTGDIDNDGFGDVIVGAPSENPGASPDDAGRAYVFSGQNGEVLFALQSPNEESLGQFGFAVSRGGDLNDDGCGDVLVGAPLENGGSSFTDAGRGYLFVLPAPQITSNPSSLTFAPTEIGQSAGAQSIVVSNQGGCALQVTAIAVTGADAGNFVLGNTAPLTLLAGKSQALSVDFVPTAAGAKQAQLQISSNDPDKPVVNIALQGTGKPLSIFATMSDALFADSDGDGEVSAGETLEYTVTITNQGTGTIFNVTFASAVDANTTLVNGSVTTTAGNVTVGNNVGDATVAVSAGNVAGNGGQVIIKFKASIAALLPEDVTQLVCQGMVSGDNIPTFGTDDPATPAAGDPTVTPVLAAPQITATNNDVLLTDSNGDGLAEPGDRVEYLIDLSNSGSRNATAVVLTCPVDNNASLVTGSVSASQGTVISGNTAGDQSVSVELGTLPGNGGNANVSFEVVIKSPLSPFVSGILSQGTVSGSNFAEVPTDDPATPAANDPTLTPICQNTELIGIDNDQNVFVSLDLAAATPALVNLGTVPSGVRFEALALDEQTGLVYMTVDTSAFGQLRVAAITDILNASPVPMTIIGALPNDEIESLAIHPVTRTLYAVDNDLDRFAMIDRQTAAVTYLGPAQRLLSLCESLSFSQTSGGQLVLYGIASDGIQSQLFTIEPATGVATLVDSNSVMTIPEVEAVAANPCAALFGLDRAIAFNSGSSAQFAIVDLINGTSAPLSVLGVAQRDIEGLFFNVNLEETATPHVIVADKIVNLNGFNTIEGEVHSNFDLASTAGSNSTVKGNVTVKRNLHLANGNTVMGNVTTGGTAAVAAGATVTGNVTPGAYVAVIPVPALGFGPFSGTSLNVSRGGDQTMLPGTYNVVRCSTNATIRLASGTYDCNRLVLDAGARMLLDLSQGPITVNVDNRLLFRRGTEIIITSVAGNSKDISINYDGMDKLLMAKHSKVQGNIVAPTARVKITASAGFLGSIYARRVDVNNGASVRHHNFVGGIPKGTISEDAHTTGGAPADYALEQNYPNPFNPATLIRFALPQTSIIELTVFDLAGRRIKTLAARELPAAWHAFVWDGRNATDEPIAAGIYFYRLSIKRSDGESSLVLKRKMTLVR